MHVFIYDRSVYFSDSFISFLKDSVDGIDIHYFPKEEELVLAAEQIKPELIIMDVKYPGHNSFTLIQQLKKLNRVVVIVCMYIMADEIMKKHFLKNGADYVLDKYMEYDQVKDIIRVIK